MANEPERTGTGDPRRTLELLWGRSEPATRGPRPALTIERIVAAASEIADADGLGALSMRRLAERLGVGTMSLYRYVPGKGELIDLLFDRTLADAPRPDPSLGGWRPQVEALARVSRAMYERHPWMLDVVSGNRPPLGPSTMDHYEGYLAVFTGVGLTPAEANAAVDLVSTFVDGAARRALTLRRVQEASGMTDEEWWSERNVFWEEYFDPERFPTITATYASGGYEDPLDGFEFGLARILDGIEALLERRAAAGELAPPPAAPAGDGCG